MTIVVASFRTKHPQKKVTTTIVVFFTTKHPQKKTKKKEMTLMLSPSLQQKNHRKIQKGKEGRELTFKLPLLPLG
jgi:hypothetical protein